MNTFAHALPTDSPIANSEELAHLEAGLKTILTHFAETALTVPIEIHPNVKSLWELNSPFIARLLGTT